MKERFKKVLFFLNSALAACLVGILLHGAFFGESQGSTNTIVRVNLADLPPKNAPTPNVGKDKYIALIVANMGTRPDVFRLAMELPCEIALGFLHTGNASELQLATQKGFETFVSLPIETKAYAYAGSNPIACTNDPQTNIAIIAGILDGFPGAHGAYVTPHQNLTQNDAATMPLLRYLGSRKAMLVMGSQSTPSMDVLQPFHAISADVVIDDEPNTQAILASLDLLVSLAAKRGSAVGYANTYPITLNLLSKWVAQLPDDVKLIPISKISYLRQ